MTQVFFKGLAKIPMSRVSEPHRPRRGKDCDQASIEEDASKI